MLLSNKPTVILYNIFSLLSTAAEFFAKQKYPPPFMHIYQSKLEISTICKKTARKADSIIKLFIFHHSLFTINVPARKMYPLEMTPAGGDRVNLGGEELRN